MIGKFEYINKIDVKLYGAPLDDEIVSSQKNRIIQERSIPFSFKYNGSWLVKHSCLNCKEECTFGLDYDIKKSEFPRKSFKTTKYVCSKYFSTDFLHSINKVFNTVELIELNNNLYLVNNDGFNPDFPVSSSIKLVFYECDRCKSKYLCILKNEPPYSPDKGCPEGTLGEIHISEIIQVEHTSNYLNDIF